MSQDVAPGVTVARQPGLFDSGEPAVDVTFAGARRIELDATSWIEHVPGWLSGSDALFTELLEVADWEQRERRMWDQVFTEPRLTAEYPKADDLASPLMATVRAALSEHYEADYDSLWINHYRSHRDGTGWHGDMVGKRVELATVPVLSLGATRTFLIRPGAGGESLKLRPAGGDLVVMGGRCQRDWQHCVPKQATEAGPRISVNFAPR